jgi:prevent-host-death family protein
MQTVPMSDAKAHLTKLLKEVEDLGEGVIITRSGRPAGILLNVEEYEGLLETLEILADPALRRALRAGLADAEKGAVLTHGEVWDELDRPVRRQRR